MKAVVNLVSFSGGAAAGAYFFSTVLRAVESHPAATQLPQIVVASSDEAASPVPGGRLKMVQVIFRHGARTPLSPLYWDGVEWDVCGSAYPRAPMAVTSLQDGSELLTCLDGPPGAALQHYPGGCTRGELTLVGQLQALELGAWLRRRYVDGGAGFLPARFDPRSVLGFTTNFRRTRDTLHGVLTGLYPDGEDFRVRATGLLEEFMSVDVHRGGPLNALYEPAQALLAVTAAAKARAQSSNERIRARLDPSATDDGGVIKWSKLHDSLTSRHAHHKELPPALEQADLDEINRQATAVVVGEVATALPDGGVRLRLGRGLRLIQRAFDDAVSGASDARVVLWSGHDTTVMPTLIALGQEVSQWSPYASSIVLELWQAPASPDSAGGDHFVRILYNQREIKLPHLPAEKPLTLAEFREHVLAPFAQQPEAREQGHFTHESSLPGVASDAPAQGGAFGAVSE